MSLIVEDGTGKSDAESYISVADADTYHSNRGNTAWASLLTAVKEQSLRKATDYMGQTYRLRYKGTRTSGTQALDFPRQFVEREDYQYATLNGAQMIGGYFYYPADEVPNEIKYACAELALRASSTTLNDDLTQGVVREKVDVLEVEYDKYSSQKPRYPMIDGLIAPFLEFSSNTAKVKRV